MASENAIVTLSVLNYYDTKLKAWVTTELDKSIAGLGTVFTLKGTVAAAAALPSTDNETGDIYLVGAATPYDEYYWTGSAWELMGTTATSLDGVVMEEALYAGSDGIGTVADPADGTIIAAIYTKIKSVQDAVDKAQTEVDELETLIGTLPADAAATVIGYVDEKVAAAEIAAKAYADELIKTNITDNQATTDDIDALFAGSGA